jgi:hypothetical protein
MSRSCHAAAATVLVTAWVTFSNPARGEAQETVTDVLSFLLTNRAVATDDFDRDAQAAEQTRANMSRLLLVELATLPIGSASPGFTYQFDRALGTVHRATESFGTFFVERSLTGGRGQASVGFNIRLSHFSTLDGFDLRNERFVTTANRFRGETTPFDEETLQLDVQSTTFTAFGSYGLTDRLDLSVAVPFVILELDGERVNRYYDDQIVQARATALARGFADMAVRTKFRVAGGATGFALVGEVLLPTGREEDLLGSGTTSVGALAVASAERGIVSAHFNGGFTSSSLADQLHWRAALAVSVSPRFTAVGELVGRRLSGVGGLDYVASPHPSLANVETLRLATVGSSLNSATAVGGFKWNVHSTWLVTGQLAFAVTHSGLRSPVTAVFGLDYTFEQ